MLWIHNVRYSWLLLSSSKIRVYRHSSISHDVLYVIIYQYTRTFFCMLCPSGYNNEPIERRQIVPCFFFQINICVTYPNKRVPLQWITSDSGIFLTYSGSLNDNKFSSGYGKHVEYMHTQAHHVISPHDHNGILIILTFHWAVSKTCTTKMYFDIKKPYYFCK